MYRKLGLEHKYLQKYLKFNNFSQRKGYSGVGIYTKWVVKYIKNLPSSRMQPLKVSLGMGIEKHD